MAATKATAVMLANVSVAAGTPSVSLVVDVRTYYAIGVSVKLTNGSTPPTLPCKVQVEVSDDDSNFYDYGTPVVGDTAASAIVSSGEIWLPPSTHYVRVTASGNTGQAVTVRAEITYVTAI